MKAEEQKRLNEVMLKLTFETFEAAEEWLKNHPEEQQTKDKPEEGSKN